MEPADFSIDYISNICEICSKDFNSLEEKQFHLDNIRYFQKCTVCGRYFLDDLRCGCIKSDGDEKLETMNINCGFCERIVPGTMLKSHVCFHRLQTSVNYIYCKTCHKGFKSLEALSQHKNDVAFYPYTCIKCKDNFTSQEPCHCGDNDMKDKECPFCSTPLDEIRNIATHKCFHRYTLNDLQVIKCNICQEEVSQRDLKCHLKTHIVPRKCKGKNIKKHSKRDYCRICDIRFISETEYHRHRHETHKIHGMCEVCGKTVKGNLSAHIRAHSGEKPYVCSICNKSFSLQHMLKRHELVHTDKASHLCTACGKSYKTSYSLRVHQRSHQEVKPFKCYVCSKTFTTKQWRDNHLRSHK